MAVFQLGSSMPDPNVNVNINVNVNDIPGNIPGNIPYNNNDSDKGCWSVSQLSFLPHGTVGNFECKEYTCVNGDWEITGGTNDCKVNGSCWSPISQSHLPHGYTRWYECKEFACSNGTWIETGVTDLDCINNNRR